MSEGTDGVSAAPETLSSVSEIRRPSKLEEKQQKIRQERRQRKINEGVPEDRVDELLVREDYERLPVEEKLKRHENFIAGGLQQLAQEIQGLRYNDTVLADALDVNFKALGMILTSLGVTPEMQSAAMQNAIADINTQREALAQVQRQKAEDHQKESVVAAVDSPGTPVEPEGGTSFEG